MSTSVGAYANPVLEEKKVFKLNPVLGDKAIEFAGRWEYSSTSNYTYVPAGLAVLAGYSDDKLGAKGDDCVLYIPDADEIESTNLASQLAQAERVKDMSAWVMQMHSKGSNFMRA
jgi:hypothetical protein